MRDQFFSALAFMRQEFAALERRVPVPQLVMLHGRKQPRYVEQTLEQAMVQKLAHIISGLGAIDALLLSGFGNECAVIKRTLDDTCEEVVFLLLGLQKGLTPNHIKFLTAFWEELFDNSDPMRSTMTGSARVSVKAIRAYNARALDLENPSHADRVGFLLHKAYSAFVHANSPSIMDMYDEGTGRFLVSGLNGSPRIGEHIGDAANYFYRGLTSLMLLATALGDMVATLRIKSFSDQFINATGVEV